MLEKSKKGPVTRIRIQLDERIELEKAFIEAVQRIPRSRSQEFLRRCLLHGFMMEQQDCDIAKGYPAMPPIPSILPIPSMQPRAQGVLRPQSGDPVLEKDDLSGHETKGRALERPDLEQKSRPAWDDGGGFSSREPVAMADVKVGDERMEGRDRSASSQSRQMLRREPESADRHIFSGFFGDK